MNCPFYCLQGGKRGADDIPETTLETLEKLFPEYIAGHKPKPGTPYVILPQMEKDITKQTQAQLNEARKHVGHFEVEQTVIVKMIKNVQVKFDVTMIRVDKNGPNFIGSLKFHLYFSAGAKKYFEDGTEWEAADGILRAAAVNNVNSGKVKIAHDEKKLKSSLEQTGFYDSSTTTELLAETFGFVTHFDDARLLVIKENTKGNIAVLLTQQNQNQQRVYSAIVSINEQNP